VPDVVITPLVALVWFLLGVVGTLAVVFHFLVGEWEGVVNATNSLFKCQGELANTVNRQTHAVLAVIRSLRGEDQPEPVASRGRLVTFQSFQYPHQDN
jgi:hypothetical protein